MPRIKQGKVAWGGLWLIWSQEQSRFKERKERRQKNPGVIFSLRSSEHVNLWVDDNSSEVSKAQVPDFSLSPEDTHVLFPLKKRASKKDERRWLCVRAWIWTDTCYYGHISSGTPTSSPSAIIFSVFFFNIVLCLCLCRAHDMAKSTNDIWKWKWYCSGFLFRIIRTGSFRSSVPTH